MTSLTIVPQQPNRCALILPGGGMRVAYQAGAVLALHEAGLRYSYADGTSGGIMNLAALLSGVTPESLVRRWRTLCPTNFLSPLALRKYLRFSGLPALGDFDGIRGSVLPHLGVDIDRLCAARGISAHFNVCDFTEKEVKAIPHIEFNLLLLLAGISLPLLTPAVALRGRFWTDAAWIKDSNVMQAVRNGANEIWIVWCIGNTPAFKSGFLNQYVHMIEMSAVGALNAEFSEIRRINEAIARGERPFGHERPVIVHVIRPERPIPLDTDYLAGRVTGDALVDQGYADASAYLARSTKTGVPADARATQMQNPGFGIGFRETMSGRISFSCVDPEEGACSDDAVPVKLNACVNIRDISGFVADPEHRGGMVAHIYAPRMGFFLPAWASNLQLFAPGKQPKTHEMLYEVGFQLNGHPHWFCGCKYVRRGYPWRIWRDTTTLFVRVHRGRDRSGPVVAAGILRLGLFDLFALLSTVHTRDCQGMRQRMGAIFGFAAFFAKSLWRIYGWRAPS